MISRMQSCVQYSSDILLNIEELSAFAEEIKFKKALLLLEEHKALDFKMLHAKLHALAQEGCRVLAFSSKENREFFNIPSYDGILFDSLKEAFTIVLNRYNIQIHFTDDDLTEGIIAF